MNLLRCSGCGGVIASKVSGHYISKHRGRTVIMPRGSIIVCEKCGHQNIVGLKSHSVEELLRVYGIPESQLQKICGSACLTMLQDVNCDTDEIIRRITNNGKVEQ